MDQQPKPTVSSDGQASRAESGVVVDGRSLRRRADGVVAGQKEALELALGGSALADVLGVLVRTVEVHCEPGTLAGVFAFDADDRLLHAGASGSLPPGFRHALDGLDPGEASGPFGAALHALEPSGVRDLDARRAEWPAFHTLALAHGLKSCWVLPILGHERRALGLLVLCWRVPHALTEGEAAVAREIVYTAALVLDRERLERRRAVEDRQRSEFLSTLVHELRNPLSPLGNALELLARAGADAMLAERARSIMSRQLAQLARLVEELSDLSRSVSEMGPAAAIDPEPALQLALPAGEPSAALEMAGGARRVLVADDNDLVRESFVELLKNEGYEVRTAADGLQAVELAEQWRPQMVLLDIHMPRLSGLETARRLRAVFPPQAMALLMMSGMTLNDAWIRHAKAAGFDDCLDKSSDPREWLGRVRKLAGTPAH
jgi:CheY-like chemotaxis protein/GAF domain-containing protein